MISTIVRGRAWSAAMLAAAVSPAPFPQAEAVPGPNRIEVRVDPRVELFAIVNRLAGAEEYRKAPDSGYVRAVDEHFGRFESHAAVSAARTLRREAGISFNAVPSLAIYLVSTMPSRWSRSSR